MFQISEKYSGQDKKKTIGYLNEKDRQNLRKKQHPISRELDNYYHTILHQRGWMPNGLFIRKKKYYYADPGLGCFYEKNNVEQLKDLRELKKDSNKQKLNYFIEYKYIEDNQYVITIEYCANCEEHKIHTFHRAELYKNYAISLQKCILLRFPFIKVILKPIDTDILKGVKIKLPNVDKKASERKYINDKFKDVRIGAFEVQMGFKKFGQEQKIALLHSKLQSKQFPVIIKLLDKIVSYLPTFSGKIITYEKEDRNTTMENNKENEEDEDIYKKGLLEGLQINIYLLNNQKIINIANEAWNDIQNQQDPHKRQIIIREEKIRQKENMYKSNSNNKLDNLLDNKTKYLNRRSRPLTSSTHFGKMHKSNSMSNVMRMRPCSSKTDILSAATVNNYNYKHNYSLLFQKSMSIKSTMNNYILDKNQSNSLKGKLIMTKYTNSEGMIDIGPLPYDSYFIEVQESKQYRSVGVCLTFNTINLKNKNFIKKYIGLFTQENSFIQLHVYEINKDKTGTEDPVHLSKAKVTLKKLFNAEDNDANDNSNNSNINNNNSISEEENIERKIKIDEKINTPGIFEHTVPPGRYLLEVEKLNYETIRKFIDLEKGSNTINVEMGVERCSNLHIFVYNYEKFQEESYVPIQNVDVVIFQNSNEVLEESITDKKGEVCYLVDKGQDFLTVVVNKYGYYPIQRVYIKNKDSPVNENGEYEENLIFFLVKENFIIENNCILCITYSNLSEVNFDPNGIQISEKIRKRLVLSCFDGQKENGIISTFIRYKSRQELKQEKFENEEKSKENENEGNENAENPENENENENAENDTNNNNDNNEDDEEAENYDNIISLSFIIQTDAIKNNNYQDKGFKMNGLERYACQTIIYMPTNIFYITSPSYSQEDYCLWNLGWIDVKNQLFYQTNTLTNSLDSRIAYFSYWLEFLQALIDNKIYTNLFEYFNFDKAILYNNDRFINENIFIKSVKQLDFCKENIDEVISYIIPFFKSGNKMISLSLLKKKISSNLKNFSNDSIKGKCYENESSVNVSEIKDTNVINVNDVEANEYSDEKNNNE